MTDQWNEQFYAPGAGRLASRACLQEDDDKLTVHSVAEGFKAVKAEYGPDFHCVACNVPVGP
jgi:hypothetical protein